MIFFHLVNTYLKINKIEVRNKLFRAISKKMLKKFGEMKIKVYFWESKIKKHALKHEIIKIFIELGIYMFL